VRVSPRRFADDRILNVGTSIHRRSALPLPRPALPRPAWVVPGGDFVSAVGSGLTLPCLFIYAHLVRGLGYGTAGLVVAMIALVVLVALFSFGTSNGKLISDAANSISSSASRAAGSSSAGGSRPGGSSQGGGGQPGGGGQGGGQGGGSGGGRGGGSGGSGGTIPTSPTPIK